MDLLHIVLPLAGLIGGWAIRHFLPSLSGGAKPATPADPNTTPVPPALPPTGPAVPQDIAAVLNVLLDIKQKQSLAKILADAAPLLAEFQRLHGPKV